MTGECDLDVIDTASILFGYDFANFTFELGVENNVAETEHALVCEVTPKSRKKGHGFCLLRRDKARAKECTADFGKRVFFGIYFFNYFDNHYFSFLY